MWISRNEAVDESVCMCGFVNLFMIIWIITAVYDNRCESLFVIFRSIHILLRKYTLSIP